MKNVILATSLALLLTGSLRADVRFDPPRKESGLVVELNEGVREPQLIIPRKLLAAGDKKGASLPGMSTIVAGLALTLAFATGGLWLARHRRGSAWLIAVACLGVGVAATLADRAPRPEPKPFAQFDRVQVVIVERGEQIKLVLNKAQLARLAEAKK